MSQKLRDLIRKVRACKTAAEERAVIAKESAMIRTAIREEQSHFRHRNVAKLLFMHMLGYPTHFGQLECLKLIASPHFPEKRIGYLGMMLLLSEQADVLMLATNALKNDLNSDNKFVSGLALCTIGNLATADMSRDLAPEVDKHLKSNNPYLRKKACLAMARCLTKCPDMVEDFVERVVTLLKDRSHGVLITVVQLMTQVLIMDQKNNNVHADDEVSPCQAAFLRLVPSLVKLLRNIIGAGYSGDHDAGGADPFLQVQVLTLLRLLGTNSQKASEEMNDVLAQVATNTETSKNSGNAILYECVQTIMAVESEDGLRVLAVNILGRFLLNRDNNIRYVALNTLSKCIMDGSQQVSNETLVDSAEGDNSASSALQRHRTTVVDCLKDPDVSIRQRALELIYHLVNKENVETLTAELLNYLVVCPREHRSDICTRVIRVTEKYSPDDRWKLDTIITMLTIAGRECAPDVQSLCIIYISQASEDLRAYATHKLLKALRDDDGSQSGLLIVGIWCIGEYGDLLLNPYTYNPTTSSPVSDLTGSNHHENVVSVSFMGLEPAAIVSTVEDITKRHSCPEDTKQRALTCFAKLADRLEKAGDDETINKLQILVKKYARSQKLELQLRSCEYDTLLNALRGMKTQSKDSANDVFGTSPEGTVNDAVVAAAKEALSRMPAVDPSVMQRKRASDMNMESSDGEVIEKTDESAPESSGGDLLDLADMFGSNGAQTKPTEKKENVAPAANPGGKSDLDLLSDIFSAPAPSPVNVPSASAGGYDPFNSVPSQPSQPVAPLETFAPGTVGVVPNTAPNTTDVLSVATRSPIQNGSVSPVIVQAFTHAGLTVEFDCSKPEVWNKQNSTLLAKFKNSTDAPFYGFSLQCAVPKYVTMEMKPPTSTTIPVSIGNQTNQVTQNISVTNTLLGQKNLMLKLKVAFTSKGTKVEHMATCSGFPVGEF